MTYLYIYYNGVLHPVLRNSASKMCRFATCFALKTVFYNAQKRYQKTSFSMSDLPSVLNKKRVAKVNENVFKKVRYVIQICHLFLSLCTPLRTPLKTMNHNVAALPVMAADTNKTNTYGT